MSQVLSQDEVDALLKGVSDGDVHTETETETVEEIDWVTPYDLTNQDRIIRDRMPTLDIIFDGFARSVRSSLSASLRKIIDVTYITVEMTKFGGFLESIPLPSHLNLIEMNPLPGLSIMAVDARLVFSFVDSFFGGIGREVKIEGRDFSLIEQKVMTKFVNSILEDLKEVWESVHPINIKLVRSEINPQFVGIVPVSDIVAVASFEVEMEGILGNLSICTPYSSLEPIRDKLVPGVQKVQLGADKAWMANLIEHLMEVEANILVELGRTTITSRELLNLQVGDVIQLEKDVTDELVLKVEDTPKFKGYTGVLKGNKALKITSPTHMPTLRRM